MKSAVTIPAVLTIAGSDSGGGAGIQTDLRTFNAFRVYGCSAITAVTAQNPNEVRQVDILSAEAVRAQIETVLDAVSVRFAKTGMLANCSIIECTAQVVAERNLQLVADPVMVSTSGAQLLEASAVSAMKEYLLPLASWVTPNIPEAELICNKKISSPEALAEAALMLYEQYKCNVILKSGHLGNTQEATDIVCCEGKLFALSSPRIPVTGNTAHGTGCTLSAALAANLALGRRWEEALTAAKGFVYGALAEKVFLSDELCQMYLPVRSHAEEISLTPCAF